MHVQINDEMGQKILSQDEIVSLVEHVLSGEGLSDDYEVSVSFVSRDEIHELNKQYRGIDKPTDVLSFNIDDPDAYDDEDEYQDDNSDSDDSDDSYMDSIDDNDELEDEIEDLEQEDELILGDVIICPEIVAEQAPGFGNTAADEMRLLITHGCLHLMGYDHEDAEEAEQMEALERRYLAGFTDASTEELNVGPTVDHKAEGSDAR